MRFPLLTKVLAVGLVIALIATVLARIGWLVDERRLYAGEAVRGVKESVGGAMAVLGPLLVRRCTEQWVRTWGEGKERRSEREHREFYLHSVPDTLMVDGRLAADPRYRGLYKVNRYVGDLTFDARWAGLEALQPRRQHAGSTLECEAPLVYLALSDPRGLRRAEVQADGQTLRPEPGTGHPRHQRGLKAVIAARDGGDVSPLAVRVALDFGGTGHVEIVPAAGSTEWALRSDWPHPSFGGRFLPDARAVGDDGFSARWKVSSLASDAPRAALGDGMLCEAGAVMAPAAQGAAVGPCLDTMMVAFFDPVNVHVLADRAVKYGLLFVLLTFMVVGLVEVMARRRVHPVQYTLVGLALSLFFLLLLALSEHIAFEWAYLAASAACAGVLAMYGSHVLGTRRAGAAFGAGVGLLYGLLYVLLQQEDKALLVGSIGLFVALAALMWLTRRVDWYARFEALRPPASMVA
jgi:inner membrane protein